jgi:5-formyltetrahydrofolate cyclo-ligase
MEVVITKSLMRNLFLDYRRLLGQETFELRNRALCQNLLSFILKGKFKAIHTFMSIKRNNEVNISCIFDQLRKSGCNIMTTKTDFANRKMEHFYLDENTALVENKLGIPEPVDARRAEFSKADLILIPLVVADRVNNRIGYGGGYYDQLLVDCRGKKLGLSLSPLLDKIQDLNDWDIKLDGILTPFHK